MTIQQHGNTRRGKTARFLKTGVPRHAARLILVFTIEEEQAIHAQWEPDEVTPDLAAMIEDICTDLSDEITATANGSLAWVDQNGAILTQKPIRLRPSEQSEVAFSGTNLDQARQAQKHLEAMSRVFLGSMHEMMEGMRAALKSQTEVMDRLSDRMLRTEEREQGAAELIDALNNEVSELREQLTEAANATAENNNDPNNQLMKLVEAAVIPQLMKMGASGS